MLHIIVVEEVDHDKRLDSLLSSKLEALSRTQVQTLLEQGAVSDQRGNTIIRARRVKTGEIYHIKVPEQTQVITEVLPVELPLDILFEDEHLLVLNKAAGMAVHPGDDMRQDTLANALLYRYG